ncbi:hypothetical protein OJAV_G00160960 [Oryzias javanicus]|uniref:C-type lectin domain-containing protein n=1 Tax=Oryzias javanicus TaxID=123683 RepID=A0A437CJP7_ORYJA|nr:hypothetical protein OJAV_G00160960 [Oryzias javanicus]
MEMPDIPAKVEEEDKEKGADGLKLEVKTKEEADTEHYAKLMSPSEEVYAEAFQSVKPRQGIFSPPKILLKNSTAISPRHFHTSTGLAGSPRLYCVISCLSLICLILLIVVIIFGSKRDACPDSPPSISSTKVNLGVHVDPGVSLTSPSSAMLTTVQTKSSVYSGKEETANNREDLSTVSLETPCMEHFRKTSYSGEEDATNNRKDPSTFNKLCSDHLKSICAGRERCPYQLHTNGSYCFFLSTLRQSWYQSQSKCISVCGSLAVITSQEVQTFLTEKGNLVYWIGLKKHESAWQWVNNKTLEKSYWTSMPGDGDCALLKSSDPPEGNWLKSSCQSSAYFICQLEN